MRCFDEEYFPDSVNYAGLGKRVKAARNRCGLTQQEAAEKLRCSISFLGHIERGTRKASVETLFRLSQVMRVSLDYLLYGSHAPDWDERRKGDPGKIEVSSDEPVLYALVKTILDHKEAWLP